MMLFPLIFACGILDGLSCDPGFCCSSAGFCGSTDSHCSLSRGCQADFGQCAGLCPPRNGACKENECCSSDGYYGTTEPFCQSFTPTQQCVDPSHVHLVIDHSSIHSWLPFLNTHNLSASFLIHPLDYDGINVPQSDLMRIIQHNHTLIQSADFTPPAIISTKSAYDLIQYGRSLIHYVSQGVPSAFESKQLNATFIHAASQQGLDSINLNDYTHYSQMTPGFLKVTVSDFMHRFVQVMDVMQLRDYQFVDLATCLGHSVPFTPFTGTLPPLPYQTTPLSNSPAASSGLVQNCVDPQQVALVFVGGPSIHYSAIKQALSDLDMTATFLPDDISFIMPHNRDAFELSKSHMFGVFSRFEFGESIRETTKKAADITAQLTRNNGSTFILPRFQQWDQQVLAEWQDMGYYTIFPSIDSLDWQQQASADSVFDAIHQQALENRKVGHIITCSAYASLCLDALPRIKGLFDALSYQLVDLVYNDPNLHAVSGPPSYFCGPLHNNQGCDKNYCCSIFGYCGLGRNFCYGDTFCGWNCLGNTATVKSREDPLTSCVHDKQVALTFDDGPSDLTPLYLDILKRRGIVATFYVSGYNLEGRQSILQRILDEGHEIAHHTYYHLDSQDLYKNTTEFHLDMTRLITLIQEYSGKRVLFFRPPFGSYNQETMNAWHDLDLLPINWDIDSNDWRNPSRPDLALENVQNAFEDKQSGHIILCHDIHSACLDVLDDIIDTFLNESYSFVNQSRCIEKAPYLNTTYPETPRIPLTPVPIEVPVAIDIPYVPIFQNQTMSSVPIVTMPPKTVSFCFFGPVVKHAFVNVTHFLNSTVFGFNYTLQDARFVLESRYDVDYALQGPDVDDTREMVQIMTHNHGYRMLLNGTAEGYYNVTDFVYVYSLEQVTSLLALDDNRGYILACPTFIDECLQVDAFQSLFKTHNYTWDRLERHLNINASIPVPHSAPMGSNATLEGISPDGKCGPRHGLVGCAPYYCCSSFGQCLLGANACYSDYFCGMHCQGERPNIAEGALEEPILTCNRDKVVALTFDDGPHPTLTHLYLDKLKARNITATWFVSGYNLINTRDVLDRIVAEGHEIAHHTWNHTNSQTLVQNREAFMRDMTEMIDLVYNWTGRRVKIMRPPFGSFNQETMNLWSELDLLPVMWDLDSNDWRYVDTPRQALVDIQNGFYDDTRGYIILCHDIQTPCLTYLDDILDLFLDQNYTFVTQSDCLGVDAYQ